MNLFKITMGIATLLILYAMQNPQAITAIKREIAIYDSLNNPYKYATEATPEEMKAMEEDRIFEGLKPRVKKGGKQNGN